MGWQGGRGIMHDKNEINRRRRPKAAQVPYPVVSGYRPTLRFVSYITRHSLLFMGHGLPAMDVCISQHKKIASGKSEFYQLVVATMEPPDNTHARGRTLWP
ncbi:hypothetical protein J6590_021176 [Homalodisca vitripennis]|nr:hypothetical protein J6590_021176 [Homalodisca vitripennis]